MDRNDIQKVIESGNTALGVEFGSNSHQSRADRRGSYAACIGKL